jgi:hypothetical protein
MIKAAHIVGEYRYSLTRLWDQDNPRNIIFIMLNPSTADGEQDDPTIRKCVKFSQKWGFGCLTVLNLFAYRATNPKALLAVPDPVGPYNNQLIKDLTGETDLVVCAWGSSVPKLIEPRAQEVLEILTKNRIQPKALRISQKTGQPYHPLYLPDDLQLVAL